MRFVFVTEAVVSAWLTGKGSTQKSDQLAERRDAKAKCSIDALLQGEAKVKKKKKKVKVKAKAKVKKGLKQR